MITEVQPVRIFIAYSHKDRVFLDELRSAAVPLERSGKVRIWYDGNIEAGKVWDAEIKTNLHTADIILLLISNNSLASDYFYEQEVADALERHRRDEARVVPVILSHCFWDETPLYELQGVPTGAKPVSTWPDRHEAWHNVLSRVRDTIRELKDLRDAAARAMQEAADHEQAILIAAEEARKQRLSAFESARTKADNLYSKKQWQAAFEAYNHALRMLEPDFPDTTERLKTRLRGCEIGIGKERKKQKEATENAAQTAREQQLREQADHDAWEFTEEANTEPAYKKYLQKYPDGLHASQAKKKIAAFEQASKDAARKKREQEATDKADWQTADNANTPTPTAPKRIYADLPRGDIFLRVSDHLEPQSTFFVIKVDTKDPKTGTLSLVDDEKTREYAFSIFDVLRDACVMDGSTPYPTLKTQIFETPGKVELNGKYWWLVEKIRLKW